MFRGFKIEMGKDMGRGMLPAVQVLVSQCGDGGQGWQVSSGIWIISSPWTLATFLWGGYVPSTGTRVLSLALQERWVKLFLGLSHCKRARDTAGDRPIPIPTFLTFYQDFLTDY